MRIQVTLLAVAVIIAALTTGCRAPKSANWDGSIRQWGTIREVLRDGQTEGRVLLAEAAGDRHTIGLGAMESLGGEVLIVDGQVWIGQAASATTQSTQKGATSGQRATLLATASVPNWIELPIDRDVAPNELEDYIVSAAKTAGVDTTSTFPFVIKGPLGDVDIHIVNGQCPRQAAANPGSASAPFRTQRTKAEGTIVGFFAPGMAGILTHHGENSHAHVLLKSNPPVTGHLDSVSVQRGAVLKVPRPSPTH